MAHIELARWADCRRRRARHRRISSRASRPASPTICSRRCASRRLRRIALAPAMNRLMWANAATQANRRDARSRAACTSSGPGEGDQACGEVGAGPHARAARDRRGVARSSAIARRAQPLAGLKVVVTAGRRASASIPCASSAIAAPERWASRSPRRRAMPAPTSRIVSGPVHAADAARRRRASTSRAPPTCCNAVHEEIDGVDIFIATAAVADYRPASRGRVKIKKTSRVDGSQAGAHRRYSRDASRRVPRAAVRRRLRRRDAITWTQCARRSSTQEESRHDRGQSRSATTRFRAGRQRVDWCSGGRRAATAAGAEGRSSRASSSR